MPCSCLLTHDGFSLIIASSKTEKKGIEVGLRYQEILSSKPVSGDGVTRLPVGLQPRDGPSFRKVNLGRHVEKHRLTPDAVRYVLLKTSGPAGLKSKWYEPLSLHSIGTGFLITAYRTSARRGDHGHTRHRSLTTMRSQVRRATLSSSGLAGKVGL